MKSWTRAAILIALCVAVVTFERAGYYGMRSILPIRLMSGTSSASDTFKQMGLVTAFGALTPVLGGALAIVLRAPLTAAAGIAIMLGGYVLLPLSTSPTGALLGLGVVVLGGGLLKPALYGICASEVSHRHPALRAAAFVVMYGAVNASALFAATSAGALQAASDTTPVLIAAAGICSFAFLLVIALAVVDYWFRDDRPSAESGDPPLGKALLFAGGLLLISVPYALAMGLSGNFWESLTAAGISASRISALISLNTIVVVLCDAVLLVALLVVHFTHMRFSLLYLAGGGLCIVALGSTPYLAAVSMGSASEATVSAAIIFMSIGEAVVGPIMFSLAVGHTPRRFAPLAAGVWLAAASVPSYLVHALLGSSLDARTVLFALSAGTCLLCGLLALGVTHLVARFLQPTDPKVADGGTLISAK